MPGLPPARRLAELLRRHERDPIVVVTGAGVSHASGIPTFRGADPDAIWAHDVLEIATRAFFAADPVTAWRWSLERFAASADARPNPAHRALAALERRHRAAGGRLALVTQNVDGLHRDAGSDGVLEVHGTLRRVRCTRDGCPHGAPSGSLPQPTEALAAFAAEPRRETLPRCPECDRVVRPHVLWFDEYYLDHDDYRWEDVLTALDEMRLAVFVGTSFSVGVTDTALRAAALRRVPVVSVDPGAGAFREPGIEVLAAPAEEVLPQTVELLRAEG